MSSGVHPEGGSQLSSLISVFRALVCPISFQHFFIQRWALCISSSRSEFQEVIPRRAFIVSRAPRNSLFRCYFLIHRWFPRSSSNKHEFNHRSFIHSSTLSIRHSSVSHRQIISKKLFDQTWIQPSFIHSFIHPHYVSGIHSFIHPQASIRH